MCSPGSSSPLLLMDATSLVMVGSELVSEDQTRHIIIILSLTGHVISDLTLMGATAMFGTLTCTWRTLKVTQHAA